MILLHYDIKPKAIQSVRFTRNGKAYQPAEVKQFKNRIKVLTQNQYKEEIIKKDVPLKMIIEYIFKHPKNFNKKRIEFIKNGGYIHKVTKPDVTDNLQKGLVDAISGIVFEQDQQISHCDTRKLWGANNEINIIIEVLNEETI